MSQSSQLWLPSVCANEALQAGCKTQKWEHRSRMGVYLGMSPQHAHSVGLILSLTTGLVSPQFHLSFDDLFETTSKNEKESLLPELLWQEKTYFKAPLKERCYVGSILPLGHEQAPTHPSQGSQMNQLDHPKTILEQMPLGWERTNHKDSATESPKQVGKTSHPISTISPSQIEEGGALRCSSQIHRASDMSDFIMYVALASEDRDTNDMHPMA